VKKEAATLASLGDEETPATRMKCPAGLATAGAIGSLVADYPLQRNEVGPSQFFHTADWLWKNCRHDGGFFQDIIHSGVNAYHTLALAQTFLRQGDERYLGLTETVARLA
jgi:hypothetical protein